MTYLNNTSESPFPFTPNPASENAAQNSVAESMRLWAVITAGIMWMFKMIGRAQGEGQVRRIQASKPYRLMMMLLSMILMVLPGSRAEKRARLKEIMDKASARMDALYERYLTWRQRKCWMWGGGFMNAMLAVLMAGPNAASDLTSFDALIPD